MKRYKLSRKILPILLSIMVVVLSFPLSFVYAAEKDKLADVEAITKPSSAKINDSDKAEIEIDYNDKIELQWSEKDIPIGRNKDGWWAGIKVVAPSLSSDYSIEELKGSKYQTKYYGSSEWSENKSFWELQDSDKESEEEIERYIQMWAFINEEVLNTAIQEKAQITNEYQFDWDNDDIFEQKIVFKIDPDKVTLLKNVDGDSVKVYPSTSLGSVEALTEADKMSVSEDKTNQVVVNNNGNITLEWAQANAEIGRTGDNWWAGIKAVAPEDKDVATLKQAKYKALYNGKSEWTESKSFWDNQDSEKGSDDSGIERFIGLWLNVNQDIIDNAKSSGSMIENKYQFDWDGDGVFEQIITFSLDPNNITLDYTNFYSMDKAYPNITIDAKDENIWITDETTVISGSATDNGTESNGTVYTSGMDKVEFAKGAETAVRMDAGFEEDTNEFSFNITDEFVGDYYIFAKDKAGNEAKKSVHIKFDNKRPTINIDNPQSAFDNWQKDAIKITGKFADSLSGVAKVEYKLVEKDKESEIESIKAENAEIETEDEGKNGSFIINLEKQNFEGTVYIYAIDNAGLSSEPSKVSVKMDMEACIACILTEELPDHEWYNGQIEVLGNFTDNLSGVYSVKYSNGNGDEGDAEIKTEDEGKSGSFKFTIKEQNFDGEYEIHLLDRANNDFKTNVHVQMDNESPKFTNVRVDKDSWTNKEVTVTGEFDDNLSGVSQIKYKKSGDEEFTYVENINFEKKTFSFEITEQNYEGEYIIYCIDKAGNESEGKTFSVFMDVTPPSDVEISYTDEVFSILIDKITFGFFKGKCQVTLSSTDNLSGVNAFIYSYINNDPVSTNSTENVNDVSIDASPIDASPIDAKEVPITEIGFKENKYIATFEIPAQFRGYVTAKAIDNAGNETKNETSEKDKYTVVCDTDKPGITVEFPTANNTINGADNVKDYYNTDIDVVVKVFEENFMDGEFPEVFKTIDIQAEIVDEEGETSKKTYAINNWRREDNTDNWIGSFKLADNGDYTLTIKYTDKSGNPAEIFTKNNFTIDTVAPKIEISYEDVKSEDRAKDGYFLTRTAKIVVEEHNFDKEAFESNITAKNILGNVISETEAQKALQGKEWVESESGNVHTLTIPYTDDAIYTFNFNSLKDLAGNDYKTKEENGNQLFKKDTESPNGFTVDATMLKSDVQIITDKPFAYKLLDGITFGFIDKTEVTLIIKDATSGLQKFGYKSKGTVNSKGEAAEYNLTEGETTVTEEDGQKVYKYTFAIDTEYKDSLEVTVFDNSGNKIISQELTSDSNTYDGIIVDTTNPEISSIEYLNIKNRIDDKYFVSGDAEVVFNVNEEYFFKNYDSAASDAKNGKNILETLNTNVNLTITKDGSDYYQGSAKPAQTVSKFKAEFNETDKNIRITIPSVVDGNKNDGDFVITLVYTDFAKHSASATTDTVVIDTTNPVINIEYNTPVQDVKDSSKTVSYYNQNKSPNMVLTVNERNFHIEDFVSNITAVDVQGNESNEAKEFFADYFTNNENWIHYYEDGKYNHKIVVPIENFALNYTIDFSFIDDAKNNVVKPAVKYLTYDSIYPDIEISINSNVISKILNGITFGIFNNLVDAEVTITANDTVSGIESIVYSSSDPSGKIGSLEEKTLLVKNPFVNNVTTSGNVSVSDSNKQVTYKFVVPAEYRNGLVATVTDYSKKTVTANTIVNKNSNDNNVYDGIIKDKTDPVIDIKIDDTPNYASEKTFNSDFNYHIDVKDENSGIGKVNITLNGVPITKDANDKEISEYYSGNTTIKDFSFDINTSQLTEKAFDGVYIINVIVTDNAGNETSSSYEAYLDVFAPMITDFTFESSGNVYSGDSAVKAGADNINKTINADVQDKDIEIYNYYFEKNTYVTVHVYDYDKDGENNHTSGVKDIKLIAESATGEMVTCTPVSNSFVQTTDKGIGYSEKTFLVEGPFIGNIYAIAEDYSGNCPTNNESKGRVLGEYKRVLSDKYEGYVNPYDTILEDAQKHTETSSISIAPTIKPVSNETYNYSFNYGGTAQNDAVMDYKESVVPLYNSDVPVSITVSDNYSGIREIKWSVTGQNDQDNKNNQSGTLSINNLGTMSGDIDGWHSGGEVSNLITTLTKDITVSNNSNDIVILVELTDRAGNKSYDYYVLGIDKTNPDIDVSLTGNAVNGKYFNTGRTITVTVTERNFDAEKFDLVMQKNKADITVNGSKLNWSKSDTDINATDKTTYVATYNISEEQEGDYELSAKATDRANNKNNAVKYDGDAPTDFIIDSTKPIINVSMTGISANEKYFFNTDRTVKIIVIDRNFDPNDITITINNAEYSVQPSDWQQDQVGPNRDNNTTNTTEFVISSEGDYTFAITCNDLSENNVAKVDYATDDCEKFTIDKTAPTVVISQMIFQSANNGKNEKGEKVNIPITVTVSDKNIGNLYASNAVTAKEVTETLNVLKLASSTNDKTFTQRSASREKVVYSSEDLKEDGIYTLNLNIQDCAGNAASVVNYPSSKTNTANKSINKQTNFFTFSVNRKGSAYGIDGNTKKLVGTYYVQHVQNDVIIYETNVDKLTGDLASNIIVKKNDVPIDAKKYITVNENSNFNNWKRYTYTISKAFFEPEATYTIDIASVDNAKNEGHASLRMENDDNLKFVVDRTIPTAIIKGVSDKGIYRKDSQRATVTVYDDVLLSKVQIFINDKLVVDKYAKDFGDNFVDGQFVWTYDFKESRDPQKIEVKCWDAAENTNIDKDKNIGDLIQAITVSTKVTDVARAWIANHVFVFVIICVLIIFVLLLLLFLILNKRKKKDK